MCVQKKSDVFVKAGNGKKKKKKIYLLHTLPHTQYLLT